MIKVSNFGALLCFSLAMFCPSKEDFPSGDSSLDSSKKTCDFTNQSKDGSDEFQDSCSFKIHVCDWNSGDSAEQFMKASHDLDLNSFLLKNESDDTNGQHKCLQANESSTLPTSLQLNDSMCPCFGENCQFQFHYLLVERGILKAVLYTTKKV